MKFITISLFCLFLIGCKSTPLNVCEKYPGHYPDGYTDIPDEPVIIVRIDPKYPQKAIDESISGYVKFSYSVLNGSVINVKVIEASPRGVFEKEATRALKKWKYKDTFKNCVQYPKEYKLETTIDFK